MFENKSGKLIKSPTAFIFVYIVFIAFVLSAFDTAGTGCDIINQIS